MSVTTTEDTVLNGQKAISVHEKEEFQVVSGVLSIGVASEFFAKQYFSNGTGEEVLSESHLYLILAFIKGHFHLPANKMNLASTYIHWGQLSLSPEPGMEKQWRPDISRHNCSITMERGITGVSTQPTLTTFSVGILTIQKIKKVETTVGVWCLFRRFIWFSREILL